MPLEARVEVNSRESGPDVDAASNETGGSGGGTTPGK